MAAVWSLAALQTLTLTEASLPKSAPSAGLCLGSPSLALSLSPQPAPQSPGLLLTAPPLPQAQRPEHGPSSAFACPQMPAIPCPCPELRTLALKGNGEVSPLYSEGRENRLWGFPNVPNATEHRRAGTDAQPDGPGLDPGAHSLAG